MKMQQLEEAYDRLAETEPAIRILSPKRSETAEPSAVWPSLPGRIKPLPFPLEALPDAARDMVQAVAESVQVSADMPACLVLGAASASIVGRGKVNIKSDYSEQLLLYIAVSADPSERKSSAMRPIFDPIIEHQKAMQERMRDQVRDAKARARVLEKQRMKAENERRQREREERIKRENDIRNELKAKLDAEREERENHHNAEPTFNNKSMDDQHKTDNKNVDNINDKLDKNLNQAMYAKKRANVVTDKDGYKKVTNKNLDDKKSSDNFSLVKEVSAYLS